MNISRSSFLLLAGTVSGHLMTGRTIALASATYDTDTMLTTAKVLAKNTNKYGQDEDGTTIATSSRAIGLSPLPVVLTRH